jgi:hypothetical protein
MWCNPSNERKRKALVQKGMYCVALAGAALQQLFRTFRALNDKVQILRHLEEVAAELEHDMVRGGWTGKTLTLKYKLDTFQGTSMSVAFSHLISCPCLAVFTRAKSFDRWVSSKKEDLFAVSEGHVRTPINRAHILSPSDWERVITP